MPNDPLTIVAGPCQLEHWEDGSSQWAVELAQAISDICKEKSVDFIFKASFDKANRQKLGSARGPGIDRGIRILSDVKKSVGCEVLTDIHEPWQAEKVAEVADLIQIPALLCRQTDLIVAAARTGKTVAIKKGQFASPVEIISAYEKSQMSGAKKTFITERGTFFGYGRLVNDFSQFLEFRDKNIPLIFDGTSSVIMVDSGEEVSSGNSKLVPSLCRAAIAVGASALYLEVHPNPIDAKSDKFNQINPSTLSTIIEECVKIKAAII